jgi:cysteinyl-tRNA synthetase
LDYWYKVVGDDTQATGEIDEQLFAPLFDDLNTSNAITRLHRIVSEIRGHASGLEQIELKQRLKASAKVLGLLEQTESGYLRSDPNAVIVDETAVNALMEQRIAARARKDFKESDRIRDELAAMGIVIKDSKEGTTWEIAR